VSRPHLSVVIPAFNEAERLPQTLARVRAFLDARGAPYEIVVADDGSQDATAERARAAGGPGLIVTRSVHNRGKGDAVRRGMLLATGARRLMTDADLSTPIEELARLEDALDAGHDVAIGSRAVQGARIEVRQGGFREGAGRLFNWLVRLLALPGVHDTQCGFKLFSAQAATTAFERARLDGFGFDVEALFLARRAGLRIAEIPVVWRNDAATRVSLLKGAAGFLDVVRVRWNAWMGRYDRPAARDHSDP
jgi:glycosyltransferase involved in cell wall biosynthesis